MSYYSDVSYKNRHQWFEGLYFNRWFGDMQGPILDVGCAAGDFVAIKPEITEGIDIDEDNLQRARARGLTVRSINIDKGEMSQLDGDKYEGIRASQIIEHLDHPLELMVQIKRILKPGGKAVILTPNIPYSWNTFWDDYTHTRPFTQKALKMIAYDAGFTDIRISEDFKCLPGMGWLIRTFNLSPEFLAQLQRVFFIHGTSWILEVRK